MIQVNRIYLIFNRLVTKKFLVDTSEMIEEINPAIEYLSIKNKKEYFMAEWRDFLKSK